MEEQKTVLVTGAAGYWGSRVAKRLASEAGTRVIGLDAEEPAEEIEDIDFIQADVRNPLVAKLIETEGVEAVCHLAFRPDVRRSEGAFDLNVMGTMKVLGACAEAGVGKVVLKSSTAVYGARRSNSAFLREDRPLQGSRRYGYTRDWVEVEAFCNGFRHQAPDVELTILRFPGIIGPTADTPMTRFLGELSTPSLLGFDPMMQLIHEDDVVEALVHALGSDASGAFNVAAEDVLPLNKIRGLAGKPPLLVLHPFAYWGAGFLRGAGLGLGSFMPIELDYLRYSWVGDLTRMQQELGFAPRHTAEEALREFAEIQRTRRFRLESTALGRGEQRMRDIIEQRRRAREQQASIETGSEEGYEDE
jgi:UDP-glucose 4-epimerase